MRLSLFGKWERPWMGVKRAHPPRPGSESWANVQEDIRERVRAHCLFRQGAADGQGGVQIHRAFLSSKGKEAWQTKNARNTKQEQA